MGQRGGSLSPEARVGLCVCGGKEVKPVGLTVFRNETRCQISESCFFRAFIEVLLLFTSFFCESAALRWK